MIGAIWLAIRTSPTLLLILAALAGYGGLKGYGKYQHYSGVKTGELQMAEKVEKKANDDAKIADAAAESVAAGRPGRPDPFRLRK